MAGRVQVSSGLDLIHGGVCFQGVQYLVAHVLDVGSWVVLDADLRHDGGNVQ
ncbi:hypothetical protein [Streptomyces griseus]|uniref:hypothetical protein n=1 Tax=Streptomyces griseus TaxID=1911 RepID=UPI00131EB30B|nr:hypothetical protein [Streptomyces griseus]